MNFVELVKQEMDRRGWNESDLARESDMSRQAINFLLSGRTKSPSIDTINKIARAFRLPVEEFARAAGLLPPIPQRDAVLKRLEQKAAILKNVRNIEKVEKFIDLLAEDEEAEKKRSPRSRSAASSSS